MKRFSHLINRLGQSNKTNDKVSYLVDYFDHAPDQDKIWALALFTGRRPRRHLKTGQIRAWVTEAAGIPEWLFEESYHVVGDLAETISLMLPEREETAEHSQTLSYWMEYLDAFRDLEEREKKERLLKAYHQLDRTGRFVFTKLLTGGWRIGVSQNLVIRALSEQTGIDTALLTFRITGNWDPFRQSFEALLLEENRQEDASKPYPFYLAYPLDEPPANLGKAGEWQAEWKWDGIRGQIIVRSGEVFVWTRGEELATDKYPEFHAFLSCIPEGTVLDGEIMAFRDDRVLPFSHLQRRIGRKSVSRRMLREIPVVFFAYDLLEWRHEDIRNRSLKERRMLLESLSEKAAPPNFRLSPSIRFSDWKALAALRKNSRENRAEGLMLKRISSPYETGRKRGNWWKWKVDPLTVDGIMIYAQKGHGRRADLFSDYTFAVWHEGKLVPFAKAYSGLTDKEMAEVDRFVKRNTLERFGPVRTVNPELVFEIAFEGIQPSNRHKSGVALRFPRISRWRRDKKPEEANNLEYLQRMMETYETGHDQLKNT